MTKAFITGRPSASFAVPTMDCEKSCLSAAAEPLIGSNMIRGGSASAAQIWTQHRIALETDEGEVAMNKSSQNGHSLANACTIPRLSAWSGATSSHTTTVLLAQLRTREIPKGTILEKVY
jgi:hypothetical protein